MIKWAVWNSVIITVAGTPCEAVVIDDGLLVVLEHLKKNVLNETVFSLLSPIISSVFFDSREERHNGCVFWTKALQSHYIHKYQIFFFIPVSFGATTSGPTKILYHHRQRDRSIIVVVVVIVHLRVIMRFMTFLSLRHITFWFIAIIFLCKELEYNPSCCLTHSDSLMFLSMLSSNDKIWVPLKSSSIMVGIVKQSPTTSMPNLLANNN